MIRNSLMLCFIVFLLCCKREDSQSEFGVEGLSKLEARVYDTLVLNLHVYQKKGGNEIVNLSLRDVPKGIEYSFSKEKGSSSFETTLRLIVTDKVKLGSYAPGLVITSSNSSQQENFDLSVNDILSLSFSVNDATAWTSDHPAGIPVAGAIIRLFTDSASIKTNKPKFTTSTDSSGRACFYHMIPGMYYFTITKGALSNIALSKESGGISKGFAIINLDRHGLPIYRDLDGDGKWTDADRVQTDLLILYENKLSEKIIWIQ